MAPEIRKKKQLSKCFNMKIINLTPFEPSCGPFLMNVGPENSTLVPGLNDTL